MPTTYTGRIFVTLLILALAVLCIIPPESMFDHSIKWSDWRSWVNIRPGIDMVGGVSLIYKIQAPPTGEIVNAQSASLAEQVMQALKKRVDPNGVRNLVWRPIGADELEIQMPMAPHSEDAPKKRAAFTEAQAELEATNVPQSEVLAALAMPAGAARDQKLTDLAQGDPDRLTLFKSIADMSDQVAAANALAQKPGVAPAQRQNAAKILDEVGEKLDDARKHIEDDNLSSEQLQEILDLQTTDAAKAKKNLDDLQTHFAKFPARLAAINKFEAKYADYVTVRSSLDDASDLKALLKGSGVLEYHIEAWDRSDPNYLVMVDRMKPGGKGPGMQPGDSTYRWYEVDPGAGLDKPGYPPRTVEWNDKHYLLCMITPEGSMTKAKPWALMRAMPETDQLGMRVVGFEFDPSGGHLFGDLTTRWKPDGSRQFGLAVVLDDKIVSCPNINEPITTGSGTINGGESGFSDADFKYLLNVLNAGSLPAQLEDEPISERRIGSTLGADNLRHGLVACAFGLVVVAVFLVGYYYIAGLVAFSAVLMNLVIILGALAAMGATFTLPSIAAVVLSVGTAVDANVLIFERLREEQHRGLGLRMALRNSYDRAFSAIIDSNMTSIITSFFLYMNGSEEVKGFGLTLIIGILASLITALYVTKTIFGLMIDKFGVKHLGSFPLTFPKWDKLLKPNIDWMGMAWIFYTFSAIAITAGLILFGVYTYRGEMMDIEFAAGTSVEVELKQPMPIEDVRRLVNSADAQALPAPSVVSIGADQTQYEIVTPSAETKQVRKAILDTLGTKIKTDLPSTFIGVEDKTVDDALQHDLGSGAGTVLFPIPTDLSRWPGGKAPDAVRDMGGGVAIHLTNINPPLSTQQIRQRIDRDRPQAPGHEKLLKLSVIPATAGADEDAPAASAYVLIGNPALAYSPEREGQWREELARPAWDLVKGAVNREAPLRQVNSFNPSVAGDTRRAAGISLVLSIVVIMAYIWVRFGNLKYGTATVVALLHDTIFTLAALGFAHLLANSPIAGVLELQPFRINLTVVAGVLTIMGYSMIDTIVVFDRIRENRGKYGHLSRMVINDAVNQTLSRTLLTCGTTTMTVAFMYFMGGDGIHGFTFVLLIGILVGTYSSVAIAAPILLVGNDAPPPGESLGGQQQKLAGAVR